jgi:hypothetical protein
MKINPEDYLTAAQAAEAIGTNKRGFYRIQARLKEAGVDPVEWIFGRAMLHKRHIPLFQEHFFPSGSANREEMAKKWGAVGGYTKALNREAALEAAGKGSISARGGSGTSGRASGGR